MNDPWFFSLTDENDQIKTHDGHMKVYEGLILTWVNIISLSFWNKTNISMSQKNKKNINKIVFSCGEKKK